MLPFTAEQFFDLFARYNATVLYPLIGAMTGHLRAELPMFGVTPCPVTIFTLGMLLLTRDLPLLLLVILVMWSLIGGSAAILLQVPQDWLLLASGLIAIALVLAGGRKSFRPIWAIRRRATRRPAA